ncbi:MAG: ABC-three component system protein [Planctomycetaceae bacterium]
MRIDYHDLSDDDFEHLVVAICMEILGPGVVPFSKGKDGARDGRFEGTALHLPNSASPHRGKFIIQAKHTENPVSKFSDSDFSGNAASATLTKELPGVKKLVTDGHLDHYLLFSNRKISGVAEDPIILRIKADTGASSVELFGIERMDLLLKRFKQALITFGKEPMHLPLLVSCEELANVILAIASNKDGFESAFRPDELQRVSFKSKNADNGLSPELAGYIRKEYVPQFEDVRKLLAKPGNEEVLESYLSAVEELKEQIVVHRKKYADFDSVLLRIKQLLVTRDGDLARNRALTNLVVYYMYWNCDIGEVRSDASTE